MHTDRPKNVATFRRGNGGTIEADEHDAARKMIEAAQVIDVSMTETLRAEDEHAQLLEAARAMDRLGALLTDAITALCGRSAAFRRAVMDEAGDAGTPAAIKVFRTAEAARENVDAGRIAAAFPRYDVKDATGGADALGEALADVALTRAYLFDGAATEDVDAYLTTTECHIMRAFHALWGADPATARWGADPATAHD